MTYLEQKQKYQNGKKEFYRVPSSAYIKPFKIFGNLYYVGDKEVCVHLIDTGEGLILLDAGFPHTIHMLTDSIYTLGFNPRNIKMIIHTHGHYDHYGASSEYKNLYGCELLISRTDGELMKQNDRFGSVDWADIVCPMMYKPEFDRYIEDGEIIALGSTSILCLSVPGHTAGTMAFFFNVSENSRTLRAGLFGGVGKGSLSLSVLKYRNQPLSLRGDMLDSLDRMSVQHVDIMLGNHPENNDTLGRADRLFNGDADAFIDESAWPRFLEKSKQSFIKYFAEDTED